jgi:hypothetical protein
MKDSRSIPSVLRFCVFELDPKAGELRKKGMKIRLQGQPVDDDAESPHFIKTLPRRGVSTENPIQRFSAM